VSRYIRIDLLESAILQYYLVLLTSIKITLTGYGPIHESLTLQVHRQILTMVNFILFYFILFYFYFLRKELYVITK
jgi:hypothetical protein